MATGYSPSDFNAVVQTVAGEGANQPPEAQRAIASTILNRHAIQGGDLASIASDPKVYNGAATANAKAAALGTPAYQAIAKNIAPVFTDGPTTKATHFHARMDKLPAWDNGSGEKIGDQTFLDRSDLLRGDAKPPTADELEAHFAASAPRVVGSSRSGGVTIEALPHEAPPTPDELEQHYGGKPRPAATPQQTAAQKDAGAVESALSTMGSVLTHSGDPKAMAASGGSDFFTPLVHGLSQGFSDEAKGKIFGASVGARNFVLNALGKPIPYSMAQGEAAMTKAARHNLAAISTAHPVGSAVAETAGAALPWVAGGELLGAGKAAVAAPSALGRVAQLAGRVATGGVKGAALGGLGGAVTGAANAEGDLSHRLPSALQGLETGATLGGVMGAAAPVVEPVATKVAGAVGREASAAGGAAVQGVRNAMDGMTGRPVQTTAKEYLAAKSPTAQRVKGMFATPDAAESAEPTAAETKMAQSRVVQMMASKGMHTDDLRAVPQDMPHTTAEAIGSQTVNHLASLARRSGTTPDAAGTQIAERTRNFGASILDDFGKATGVHPEEAAGNIDALTSRLKGEADPMFAAVRSHPGPVWSADLAKISERPVVAKAMDAAARDLQNGGKDPTALGFKLDPDTGLYVLKGDLSKTTEQQPTAEAWENVRQRLGEQVDRHPLTGKVLPDSASRGNYNINVAKRDLTNLLAGDKDGAGGLIPGYRNALDTSGDYQGLRTAYERGQSSLMTDKVPAKDFAKAFSSLSPADQKAWTAGAANKLYEASQTSRGLTPSLVKSPAFQAKVRTMMGDQAEEFLDRLSQRVRLHATGQRIMPGAGSQTTPLLQAGEESGPTVDALGNFVKEAAHAKASPGTFLLRHALNAQLGDKAANVAETPGYRNAYGRLLLQHPRATADELRDAGREAVKAMPRSHLPVAGAAAYVGGHQQAPQ